MKFNKMKKLILFFGFVFVIIKYEGAFIFWGENAIYGVKCLKI